MDPLAAFVTVQASGGEALNLVMPVTPLDYDALRPIRNIAELALWLDQHLAENSVYEDIRKQITAFSADDTVVLRLEYLDNL